MEAYVHDAVLDMQMARAEVRAALADVGEHDWGRAVPYGSRTLHELLAHLAGADQAWAVAAQGLLKGEGEHRTTATREQAQAARTRAIERGRGRPERELLAEMERRRELLLGLYELLEPRHLALALSSYGGEHNSARERIWVGYHDRLHAADVRRAMRMSWHPPKLTFSPLVQPAVDALDPGPTLYVVYSVDPSKWEAPSLVPGWSNRMLLAHIATGDWVFQMHLRHILETGEVAGWADVDAGNAERIAQRRFSADRALVDEYLSMRHETMLLLSQLKPKHFEAPIELWFRPEGQRHATMLEYIAGFDAHDRRHREQLRPAMKYATARKGGA